MQPIIECVPNFSEGKNTKTIEAIQASITSVEGIKILHTDIGEDANRTVITFAGHPDDVCEAAFRAVETASQLINMQKHKGIHPRIGATDVLPLVPIQDITMVETATLARLLAQRIGSELQIPVYCYEESALVPERRRLEYCRWGEYEGLAQKLQQPQWQPDFGPTEFNPKFGATVVGARNFLIAYNVNIATSRPEIAKTIAETIRHSGKLVNGERIKGLLKYVKAIGWYVPEYGQCQVSTNLINFINTPVHVVFETIKEEAAKHNVKVTGSELIGLIPISALIESGKYYSQLYNIKADNNLQWVQTGIEQLGLNDLKPFEPNERIIEYILDI